MHHQVWLHDPDFQQGLLQRPELAAAIARLEEWAASLPAKFQVAQTARRERGVEIGGLKPPELSFYLK